MFFFAEQHIKKFSNTSFILLNGWAEEGNSCLLSWLVAVSPEADGTEKFAGPGSQRSRQYRVPGGGLLGVTAYADVHPSMQVAVGGSWLGRWPDPLADFGDDPQPGVL